MLYHHLKPSGCKLGEAVKQAERQTERLGLPATESQYAGYQASDQGHEVKTFKQDLVIAQGGVVHVVHQMLPSSAAAIGCGAAIASPSNAPAASGGVPSASAPAASGGVPSVSASAASGGGPSVTASAASGGVSSATAPAASDGMPSASALAASDGTSSASAPAASGGTSASALEPPDAFRDLFAAFQSQVATQLDTFKTELTTSRKIQAKHLMKRFLCLLGSRLLNPAKVTSAMTPKTKMCAEAAVPGSHVATKLGQMVSNSSTSQPPLALSVQQVALVLDNSYHTRNGEASSILVHCPPCSGGQATACCTPAEEWHINDNAAITDLATDLKTLGAEQLLQSSMAVELAILRHDVDLL
jgi:hypothetical protein